MDSQSRVIVKIEGHVQGVGFRFFAQEQAQRLALTGWVRNTFQGEVEAVAEGSRENIESWLKRLRSGPGNAYVTNLKVEWSEYKGEFKRFQIVSTL
ncbi:MAG: acylphosphatase [Chloroflexi bacterium HGW-Chloroflexi-10]|nr:MAG: acylphosphatase [Chloroflexi bacterium HGW-Chloroflexi-10]